MKAGRIAWPDYVKGVGIFLVCLHHVLSGLLNNAILAPGPVTAYLNTWFYTTVMTVFFFASGMFARRSAVKPPGEFFQDKLRSLAYPYVLWSAIQVGIMLALAGRTTHAVSWVDLVCLPFMPVMQFWFLYTLLAMMAVFALLVRSGVKTAGLLAISLALKLLRPVLPDEWWFVIHKFCEYFVFFCAGAWLGPLLVERLARTRALTLAAAAALGLGAYSLNVYFGLLLDEPGHLASGALTVAGFVALGGLLERFRAHSLLIRLGQASLAIYCGHTIGSAGVRIVLKGVLGVDSAALHLVLGVAGGFGFPLGLWMLAERFGFPYLFQLPPRREPKQILEGAAG